jgi:opacity protein-like surface antigen
MRRLLLITVAAAVAASPFAASAQLGGAGRGQQDEQRQQQDAAKKKKSKEEWSDSQAPLPAMRNAGPCPFVKALYDAGRYVEFKDDREASANVGFSGEIQGISAGCQYKDDQPIQVSMEVLFELGKGPQASGSSKDYRYWVAVSDGNREVMAKQTFDLPVKFNPGQDRVYVTEQIQQITIPRGALNTSGANFEVLVGFEVTPQMAAFNREGKRFRVNAGSAVAAQDASKRR